MGVHGGTRISNLTYRLSSIHSISLFNRYASFLEVH